MLIIVIRRRWWFTRSPGVGFERIVKPLVWTTRFFAPSRAKVSDKSERRRPSGTMVGGGAKVSKTFSEIITTALVTTQSGPVDYSKVDRVIVRTRESFAKALNNA